MHKNRRSNDTSTSQSADDAAAVPSVQVSVSAAAKQPSSAKEPSEQFRVRLHNTVTLVGLQEEEHSELAQRQFEWINEKQLWFFFEYK